MIKVTLELDYPNFQEANEKDPYLSALIGSDKCISFERKEEVSVKEYDIKRNEKKQEFYANMKIDPDNTSAEMKEVIEKMAFDWVKDNYYFTPHHS